MLQFKFTLYIFLTGFIGLVNTVHIDDFLIIIRNEPVYMMSVIVTRQIGTTHRPITQRTLFVYKIIQVHIGAEHHLTFRIHIMHRTT